MDIERLKELRNWLEELEDIQVEISVLEEWASFPYQKARLTSGESRAKTLHLTDGDRKCVIESLLQSRYKREHDLKKFIDREESKENGSFIP